MTTSHLPVPTVLAFNLNDAALSALRGPCQAMGLRLKPVPRDGFSLPIGAMAGLAVRAVSGPLISAGFDDPMLVMCGLDEQALNGFLLALRALPLPPIPLKAVLTPTNAAWSALALRDELAREHAEMARRRQQKQP